MNDFIKALKEAQKEVEAKAPTAKFAVSNCVSGYLNRTWSIVDKHYDPLHETWKYALADKGFDQRWIPECLLNRISRQG